MPAQTTSFFAASDGVGTKEKHSHNSEHLAGFIFMCSGTTKQRCFQYRVFGLPMSRQEVLGRIKPGAKLFLFDFDSKFLYGVYEATSEGKTYLEPNAFYGKFLAQVKFRIFKECIPLPEKSFKSAILDNYTGSKFKQELNKTQVESLISLFQPLSASLSTYVPLPLPNAAPSWQMRSYGMEDQYKHPARMMSSEDTYANVLLHSHVQTRLLMSRDQSPSSTQLSNPPQVTEPQLMPEMQTLQHPQHRTPAPHHSIHVLEHQYVPAPADPYYYTDAQQAYLIREHAQITQEPYSSYGAVQNVILPHQPVVSESHHHGLPLQGEGETSGFHGTVAGYNHALMGTDTAAYYAMQAVRYSSQTAQPQGPASGWPQLNVPSSSYYPYSGE